MWLFFSIFFSSVFCYLCIYNQSCKKVEEEEKCKINCSENITEAFLVRMQPNKEDLGLIWIERTGILTAVSVRGEMNSLFCFACWKAFLT
jgi:hypothetical protein